MNDKCKYYLEAKGFDNPQELVSICKCNGKNNENTALFEALTAAGNMYDSLVDYNHIVMDEMTMPRPPSDKMKNAFETWQAKYTAYLTAMKKVEGMK